MKKAIKWFAIVAGILVVLLAASVIALPFFLPLDKIKDLATAKISEMIDRQVKVEKISFNLFEGIKLEGLTVSNRVGFAQKNFISADAIVLRYAFWPLFQRQVIIKEIRLVKPEILIEKQANGEFNFSDLTGGKKPGSRGPVASSQDKKTTDFSLIVDTFSIRDGKITYIDHGTNNKLGLKKADLTVSGITLALLKPIGLNFSALAEYRGKDVPLSLAGEIGLNLADGVFNLPNLSLGIAGEKATVALKVSDLQGGPAIDLSLRAGKLELDPLLAVFTAGASAPPEKKKLARGELTALVNKQVSSLPARLRARAALKTGELRVLGLLADKTDLTLALANRQVSADIRELAFYEGVLSGKVSADLNVPGLAYQGDLKLAGLNASPFSNAVILTFLTRLENHLELVDKVYGSLDLSLILSGRGVEVPDIMAAAVASGSLTLKNGELKRLKTLDAIADQIKTPALKQDLKISLLTGNFTFKDQVLDLKELDLKNHDLNLAFKGGIDLGRLKFVPGNRLTLKGSPGLTKDLPREYNLFRDKEGWLEITFELTGDLKKPIPAPVLEKPLEAAVEKLKIKVEAKKVEIEQAAQKKLDEEKAKAEEAARIQAEEAKKKAEEEAKKQLKQLIKF